jgi:IS30 family transposase
MSKPAFSPSEIDTVHAMHAAGCSLKSIAASLGRSKAGVARYIPAEDGRNRWDAVPPVRAADWDWRARWERKMPAMREAMRKAGEQP